MNKILNYSLFIGLLAILGLTFLLPLSLYLNHSMLISFIRIGIILALIQIYTRSLFIQTRFFVCLSFIAISYVLVHFFPFLDFLPLVLSAILLAIIAIDAFLLFAWKKQLTFERELPEVGNLDSPNNIQIHIYYRFFKALNFEIIDELPIALQERNFIIKKTILPFQKTTINYTIRPLSRGLYEFGDLHLYVTGFLGFLQRKYSFTLPQSLKIMPSIQKAVAYEKLSFESRLAQGGLKKIRKIGQNYEFAQIRNYTIGDDYRAINWKATSRKNDLMVNTFEDEKSQQIYCVIDKGRQMHLEYHGLSILDHAINNVLVLSNIILKKQDKIGLLTFSDKIGTTLKANSGNLQMKLILEYLYKEQPRQVESNYNLLYLATKQFIKRRSLLLLHTNFETFEAMYNVLPILRKIANTHLLVVIIFRNNAIEDMANHKAKNTYEIYEHAIAKRFVQEKEQMISKLKQYGIQAILTDSENLSTDVVNKYLELKARNMI